MAEKLAGAAWLICEPVRKIFGILDRDGEEARIVGGAVRNALMGLPITDLDFATTATPDIVAARAAAAGMKVVPTGAEHGTLTLVADHRPFEVTTLRADIETDGRHAVVRFGRDWDEDARRRDFTMNALSVGADGVVHDPVGGISDIRAGRVRFIGAAATRIAEDRLRILRFFRFHAQYGAGDLDPAGLAASIRARGGLRDLSGERLGQEMRKLVVARGAPATVAAMQEAGVLGIVLGGVARLAPFARMPAVEAALGAPAEPALRLAVLGVRIDEDAERIARLLRLPNAERDRMRAVTGAGRLTGPPSLAEARVRLYRLGAEGWQDAVLVAAANDPLSAPAWRDLHGLAERWPVPRFPLSGRDLIHAGATAGPTVGTLLRALEAWWVERDFAPDEAALRARMQQMVAAAQ